MHAAMNSILPQSSHNLPHISNILERIAYNGRLFQFNKQNIRSSVLTVINELPSYKASVYDVDCTAY